MSSHGVILKGHDEIVQGDRDIHSLNVVIFSQGIHVSNVQSHVLKHVQFIVYQLYLPEAIKWGDVK